MTATVTSPTVNTATRDRRLIAGALALALVLRVVLVAATRSRYAPVLDAFNFNIIATSISRGHGFGPTLVPGLHGPSAFRTPLWPGVLGGLYYVTGVSWTAGRLVMAVIGTGLVGAIGAVAWKVAGRKVGLVCLFLAAVYPPLLMAGYGLNYEALMALLVFGALLCGLQWRDHPERWVWLALAGILTGAAILCRENTAFVLVPLWIFIWQSRIRGSRGQLFRRWLGVTLCAAAVVVPWTIRNAVELHAFVPVSDSPGYALAGAYNPVSLQHLWSPNMWIVPTEYPAGRALALKSLGLNEAHFTAKFQTQALDYVKAHPSSVPKVVVSNLYRLFSLGGYKSSNWIAPYIPWPLRLVELSVVSFWGATVLAAIGAFTKRARKIPWALWVFPVLWCASILLTVTTIQYRLIAEPFLLILAAAALVQYWERYRKRAVPNDRTPDEHAAAVPAG
jgi:4-amino-4-deoxy-L-arabinose transferase-like glycosyltransferase